MSHLPEHLSKGCRSIVEEKMTKDACSLFHHPSTQVIEYSIV